MKFGQILITVLIAAAVAYGASRASYPSQTQPSAAVEPAFERVKQTSTIRCGFVDYEPANFRDPATGEMKGILYEVAEAIGKQTGYKIEWVQAGGWATFMTDLEQGKFDVFCGAAWGIQPKEYQVTEASGPIYYSAISAWVHNDASKFNSSLGNVNDPPVTIVATDGSLPMVLSKERFPNAKILALPETADYVNNLLNVANRKADVGFVERYIGNKYAAANPGQVKNITPDNPVHVSPNLFEVRKGEHSLLSVIDMALNTLRYNGEIDRIIGKYEPAPGTFLRQAKAYQ